MGKSKYQAKATNKVNTQQTHPKGKPKYYDEEFIKSNKGKRNAAFGVFVVAMVLIGAGTIIGITVHQENLKQAEEQKNLDFLKPNTNVETTTDDTPVITSGLKPGDDARLQYTLWVDWDKDGIVNTNTEDPYQGPAEFPITSLAKGQLINGFYNEILGMQVGQTKTFEIPVETDANNDGLNDATGKELLGYGPGAQLYGYKLVFTVTVLSIN